MIRHAKGQGVKSPSRTKKRKIKNPGPKFGWGNSALGFIGYEQIKETNMGWLSKIFKGSSHKVSEGHHHDGYDEDPASNEASTSEDQWATNEDEDINQAIALSIAEEEERRKQVVDFESQLKEDELLARALQESLNIHQQQQQQPIPPRSAYENGNFSQPIPPFSTGYRICAGCHNEIGFGRFLSCMGAIWHPECFRCHACSLPISGYEFSMYGGYPYHKVCYKEQYHPKCGVCNHFIPTNVAGLIEYRAHPFWDQKYCPAHEVDGTPRCCSCERMEPQGTGYVSLDDGRKLCLECFDSAIMDTNHCQPLYFDIKEFYENLGMKVEQEVPLLLVERQALNEAMVGEKHGHHHMPETRGLCLSEEQTITTVSRRPKQWGRNGNMNIITEPYKLSRQCEVTAILILYGLPRLLTGSILAHEMMHAWLRLRGFRMLNPQIEEGICQVLAYLWLETQLGSGASSSQASSSYMTKRSPFELKLGKFFKNQIESDVSPIYGDGFRAANQTVLKYGLKRALDHLWMTDDLDLHVLAGLRATIILAGQLVAKKGMLHLT
ncbi:hypothetical protein V2J09_007550 [Rumex salicifolius]